MEKVMNNKNESSIDQNMGYIGGDELVFNNENGIQSGGFSVSSILMKAGISPVMTTTIDPNTIGQKGGGENKVSDLFQHLAVPNWTTMYTMKGGEYKEDVNKKDDYIEDDLHDKLLELVKEHENKVKKRFLKTRKRSNEDKKNNTKKRREKKVKKVEKEEKEKDEK